MSPLLKTISLFVLPKEFLLISIMAMCFATVTKARIGLLKGVLD